MMDRHRENRYSGSDVVHDLAGNFENNAVNEMWGSDQSVWATEDDYGMWNGDGSFNLNSCLNNDGRVEPPNKRYRSSDSGDLSASNRSKAIGKMFYKTKLCCKFRAGTCPYINNCNFAHSTEELRKPPPNWQEIVAAHEDERASSPEFREEFQIPIVGVSDETQRSYKGRHCKKFYTEEGCPYGESCTFLHDEQSRSRESVAISLGPSSGNGGGTGYGGNGGGTGYGGNGSGLTLKPSNWKTRICNKWELTGYCPFGSKCHFAHGSAELHQYGGAMDSEIKDSSTPDAKQVSVPAKTSVETAVGAVAHSDGYHIGIPSQRLSNVIQKTGERSTQKWKGPDKISKIYGDWIDDL